MMLLSLAWLAAACTSSVLPVGKSPSGGSPTPYTLDEPGPAASDSRDPYITDDDDGDTFTFRNTSRFGFWLKESRYPFRELDVSRCPFFGHISNWSLEGPGRWPSGFEIAGPGRCTVRIRDFEVHIVGVSD